jgi:hypothetical protein
MMSRSLMNRVVTLLAALVLMTTISAQATPANDSKTTVKTTMSLVNATSLAGKQLKPGDYEVTADQSAVRLSLHGKVVAEAPVQWKDDSGKADRSTFVVSDSKIVEIHFGGKARYVTIAQESAAGN